MSGTRRRVGGAMSNLSLWLGRAGDAHLLSSDDIEQKLGLDLSAVEKAARPLFLAEACQKLDDLRRAEDRDRGAFGSRWLPSDELRARIRDAEEDVARLEAETC